MIGIAIVTPFLAALTILILREEKSATGMRSRNGWITVTASLVSFLCSFPMIRKFASNYGEGQLREVWWNSGQAGIKLIFSLDGISFPLFITTTFLFLIAALFSVSAFSAKETSTAPRGKVFWGMLLLLETFVLGIFAAWNYVIFFAFWELFLIPITILLWRFGLEERRKAALQFFLYTFISSALLLAAFAALVYYTPRIGGDFDFRQNLSAEIILMPIEKQRLIFLFFMAAFLVKMPLFPFHAWLPLTHTQAPVGTLLLSGLFLKMGSYGILRFVTPNLFAVTEQWGTVFIVLGVFSMFYGAFAAYRQKSFRSVIAYSSLAHMGLLLVGTMTRHEYAVSGAIIQNVAHSLANALLFVVVCMHMSRAKTDNLADMQPPRSFVYWAAFSIAVFSAIAVPGTIGFVGEFLILFGLSFKSWPLTMVAIFTVVLSAAYMLRLFHKIRKNPVDTSWRPNGLERICLILLSVVIIGFGVYPTLLGDYARNTAKALLVTPAQAAPITPNDGGHK